MEQGPVACLAQLAFFNINRKKRKAGTTEIQEENGRQEHHSLQGLHLFARNMEYFWFFLGAQSLRRISQKETEKTISLQAGECLIAPIL